MLQTPQNIKKTFSKYGLVIKKIPWLLASHAFLFILVFVCLELVLGELLFYHYVSSPAHQQIQVTDTPAAFGEKTYQSVLGEWAKRQNVIDNFSQEKYNNPF